MNGVTFEIEFSDREEANEPQTRPQPEEIVTTRVISQHPLLKAGVIGSGIFLLIAVAGGMINTSMDALSNSSTVKPEAIKQGVSGNAQDLESQSENPGKIKTALAITSQKPELESLRNTSRSKAPVKEENTIVKSSPVTASTSSPPIVSPPTQRQYTSISPSQPIVIPPNPTIFREPLATKSFSTLSPRPRPQSIALVSSSSNKPNLDQCNNGWLFLMLVVSALIILILRLKNQLVSKGYQVALVDLM